jgi:hypothetical protein
MKRKESMAHMTISVPNSLREEMEKHHQINWSSVASAAFRRRLSVEETLKQFEEEGVTEEEALERALRVQHPRTVTTRAQTKDSQVSDAGSALRRLEIKAAELSAEVEALKKSELGSLPKLKSFERDEHDRIDR